MKIKVVLIATVVAVMGFVACEKANSPILTENEISHNEKSLVEVNTNQFMSFVIPEGLIGNSTGDIEVLNFDFEVETVDGEIYRPEIRAGFDAEGKLTFVEASYEYVTLIGYDASSLVDFLPDDVERKGPGLWKKIKVFFTGNLICGACVYGLQPCWREYANGKTASAGNRRC